MSSLEDAGAFRFGASMKRTDLELDFMEGLAQCMRASIYSETERMMNFPLYAPRQDLSRFLCKYEIFKRVLDVQGSIVECGVSFGGGLLAWAQFSSALEPFNHQRRVIGFDTFAGFPELAEQDDGADLADARVGGLAVDSYEEISRCAALLDMNRPIGHIPKVELVRGDATEMIPAYVRENSHLVVSLLYLDFDIYEPTKVAIENFLPRMPKGAVIAFDELNLSSWPGETVAALEALDLNELRLERFPFTSTISFAQIGF